jgi:hypothetical protein
MSALKYNAFFLRASREAVTIKVVDRAAAIKLRFRLYAHRTAMLKREDEATCDMLNSVELCIRGNTLIARPRGAILDDALADLDLQAEEKELVGSTTPAQGLPELPPGFELPPEKE